LNQAYIRFLTWALPSAHPIKHKVPSNEVSVTKQDLESPPNIETALPLSAWNILAWFLSDPPAIMKSFLGFVNFAL